MTFDYTEIMNKIFNDNDNYIDENELHDIAKENCGVIVYILSRYFNAEYIPPLDNHYCGGYCFENPLCTVPKTVYRLYSKFKNTDGDWFLHMSVNDSEDIINCIYPEIVQLDHGVTIKNILDDIIELDDNKELFIGDERLWKIQKETEMVKED